MVNGPFCEKRAVFSFRKSILRGTRDFWVILAKITQIHTIIKHPNERFLREWGIYPGHSDRYRGFLKYIQDFRMDIHEFRYITRSVTIHPFYGMCFPEKRTASPAAIKSPPGSR
ncbi:hypothetical protein DRW41_01140 [Neobacillus piezotolerans]|uniref:Uncharacterized protein n=1 Tax=Neobacillus piezotolerans TaxID=2259171 RepID=A0A3D8GUQ0_9BACI|nr:hypothetical protein DRW41_01140 [Neobacillus piezotolerans]